MLPAAFHFPAEEQPPAVDASPTEEVAAMPACFPAEEQPPVEDASPEETKPAAFFFDLGFFFGEIAGETMDGELLTLTNDGHVSGFMEFAWNSRKPPTLFVYVDYSMCNECDGGGTSNTTTQEAMYNLKGANESQMQQSNINPSYSQDHTYGLNDYYPKFVPEMQQQQEGQEQPDDEEEDHTTFRGCADDEAHVWLSLMTTKKRMRKASLCEKA
ncbi:hypothetical protein OSB04_011525 [Centaurea solstitialis]|uniref:Uncharacterized protein n=1 Tax=Centaurea solstitialis TaxID=347529 RepID=A0AA38WQ52_9ASTR|nr:hypothetical protein OSB04_011525 [Centaurea solstitialis]